MSTLIGGFEFSSVLDLESVLVVSERGHELAEIELAVLVEIVLGEDVVHERWN